MYEDHSVEEKYLYNFSDKEKKEFCAQQRSLRKAMNDYEINLRSLVYLNSDSIFGDFGPEGNTSLEIKYVLNRIEANDSRDTVFELCDLDNVRNADKLALRMAKAFHKNTICTRIFLHKIGVSDRGLLPLLRVLRHKKLNLLDISGNEITNRTICMVEKILANPNTQWKDVRLGKITLSRKQRESLKKYPNLSFTALIPLSERLRDRWSRLFFKHRER